MADQNGFPRYLLKRSPAERKAYFHEYWVGHSRITEVADEVQRLIREPADAEIIYVIGPTGVGKSTVMRYVLKKLYEEAMPELERNPGKIPAAFIELDNPDTGSYEWKDHYINTLIALDEVLIDKKIYLLEPGISKDEQKARVKKEVGGRSALRRAAQNALKNRILYAFFNDEAQFMTKRKSGEGLIDQADTIRSLAAKSGTLHVLFGTYPLRHLRNLNGQLGRRSHTVHFSRYKIEDAPDGGIQEIKSFVQAFLSFQANLPFATPPDLTKHAEFCFLRCLGCVGHLKSWFKRAYAMALEDNCETLSSRLFLKAAPSKAVWSHIAEEIKVGEEALEENDEELAAELFKLQAVSALESPKTEKSSASSKKGSGKSSNHSDSADPKTKRKKRPFKLNPKRYPTEGSDMVN